MAGIDYEDKPNDEKNDSTELTAQSQIDTILGDVHTGLHEKVITAPIPSLAPEKPAVSDKDIEAILQSVNAQRTETTEPKPAIPEAKASADDIATILASVQAQQPSSVKEEPKAATPDDIEAILASVQAQQPSPAATPPAAPAKQEVGADDIAAILASVQAQQPSSVKEEPKAATPDDIEAILASVQAQQTPPVATPTAPPAKQEVGADDIAAILASVQAQQPSPAKEAPVAATSEDIDAIFASVQAQQTPPAATPAAAPPKQEVGADDIAAILASVQAQQPSPAKETPVAATSEDIDAIFASVQAQQTPPVATPTAPPAKQEVGADDIAAILASVQAQQASPATVAPATASAAPAELDAMLAGDAASSSGTVEGQDDIDSILMTASAPAPQESILEKEATSGTQSLSNDDIDSILANVKAEKEADAVSAAAPSPAATGNDDIISQSDLDSLFASGPAAPAPPSEAAVPEAPKETENDIISQSDLDALLGETRVQVTSAASGPPAETSDIISQGDLDALMTENAAPTAAPTIPASRLLEGGDDEMDSLFASEAIGSSKTPPPQKAAMPAAASAVTAPTTPTTEYEGVDTSMFEGLDKEVAEPAAAVEEQHAEAEAKPGAISGFIASIMSKFPKRKRPEQSFTVEEDTLAEPGAGETPARKRSGMVAKLALPMAAGVALMLGAGWYYFVKMKPHPVVIAQKTAPAQKPAIAPAPPAAEKKEPPAAQPAPAAPAPTGAQEEAKAMAPEQQPPPAEPKKPEPAPVTAQAEKPKDAKELAAAAHEEARKAALEAEKLIPPALAEPSVMKVGVMLPVDFNSSQVKMMTAEVELQFATPSEYKTAETKKFVYELTLENEIEVFFKDKFYEETRYVKDRLMAYLFERVKKRGDLEKIVGVNVAELTLK